MRTLEPGVLEALPRARRDGAPVRWAAPGLAVAGTALGGTFAADGCATSLALPASGLALTVASGVLWLTGTPREQRGRIALTIAVAIALLSLAALQQLLICALGRTGMTVADLLQAGGLILLLAALVTELVRRRRSAARVRVAPPAPAPLAEAIEAIATRLGREHGIEVVCELTADAEPDAATRRALLRMLRAAIVDTAREGGTSVRVELRTGARPSVTRLEPAQATAGAGARGTAF
jgi:hypothetical protein